MSLGISKLQEGLLSLFLQTNCPLCDRPAQAEFCQYCHKQLQNCQLKQPDRLWTGKLPVFAWGSYGGIMKRTIARLKYENQPQLARPLGQWLGDTWLKSPVAFSTNKLRAVPIPVHPSKLKIRGYNQAELIARSFCQFTGYKHQPFALERVRATEAQFSLSGKEREQNLADAFVVSKKFKQNPPNSPVLLIDDIYTTGATVSSAAQTLLREGVEVYGVLAIAISKGR
ncbi:MAG: ComF family protein [Coleofasciculaceae cyanobacterium]